MARSRGVEPAAQRSIKVEHVAASNGSCSTEQPATPFASEPRAKRSVNMQHGAAPSDSGSAEQPVSSVSLEPPAKRPRKLQPAGASRKRTRNVHKIAASRSSASAAQPATSVSSEPKAKRARKEHHAAASSGSGSAEQSTTSVVETQSVAFITSAVDFATNRDLKALLQAVRHALEAGATIVNIAFGASPVKDVVDSDATLHELRKVFDAEWTGSVGQPAYVVRLIGSVMSFFLCAGPTLEDETILDPEFGIPALMLTFSAPEGRSCIINSSLPSLPQTAKERIVKYYVKAAADTQAKNILIGGHWQGNPLFMENVVNKQKIRVKFLTNGFLCLLTHAPSCAPVNCFSLDTDGPYSFMRVWKVRRSVEQPAPRKVVKLTPAVALMTATPPPPAVVLVPATPLYDNLIANLESAVESHRAGKGLMNYIKESCFWDKLLNIDVYGDPIEKSVPLSVKMETLLRTSHEQRVKQRTRLRRRGERVKPVEEMRMRPVDDMKEIFNAWCKDVGSWMKPSTLEHYNDLLWYGRRQQAHLVRSSAFSTYIFQLSGCKFLLHNFIELPLIRLRPADASVEQPAVILTHLLSDYEAHKKTKQYKLAIRRNEKHRVGQVRLSRQIWWIQYNYAQGRKLSHMVKYKICNFFDLAPWQQQLVEDFDHRILARALDNVLEQKACRPQPYRGTGTEAPGTYYLS